MKAIDILNTKAANLASLLSERASEFSTDMAKTDMLLSLFKTVTGNPMFLSDYIRGKYLENVDLEKSLDELYTGVSFDIEKCRSDNGFHERVTRYLRLFSELAPKL